MKKIFCTLIFAYCGFYAFGQNQDAIVGTFMTDGKSKIEFFKTGDTYSGKIVWLKNPNDDAGNPRKDFKNPDKSLRDRPLIGLVTITELKYEGNGKYVNGKAYRPSDGDVIKIKITAKADGSIDVTGTKFGISLTQNWKRE